MKKTAILISFSLFLIGCNNSAPSNVNVSVQESNNSTVVSSHSTGTNSAIPSKTQNSTSGNSPMAKAVDVSELTANIEKAEKAYNVKTSDAKLKDTLAESYFIRAFALTEAAQYRAALGDFRKGLKLKPDAKEAKAMHDQIIDIFKSIGREPPKEGEEPGPMPVSGETKNSASAPNSAAPERINFAPGATSAVASGELKDYDDSKTFVIAVKKGQTLTTEQDKSDSSLHYITVYVKNPAGAGVGDSDASCNNRREITPTEAGDYQIQVVECKKADAWKGNFKLKVSVK